MTLEDALHDDEVIDVEVARAELARHSCRILAVLEDGKSLFLEVTNDLDPTDRIECTPRAILGWLGY